MGKNVWFQTSYRRNLVDMHIEDWDERFLAQFDPNDYVQSVKKSNIQTAMIYANSHVGLCYWPTETGKMHGGLKGRDILGEIIRLFHQEKIDVIIYYSLVYNNWVYENYPLSRIMDVDGIYSRDKADSNSRYGICCPNSLQYRDFITAQIAELCAGYEFEGVFFDMTFWPAVCYCHSCRERYSRETGADLPRIIDWNDIEWQTFQRKREEWLSEFAFFATETLKKHKPHVTVEHQFSPATQPWYFGTTQGISKASDYAGGDLYGGFMQQSFVCKLYYSLTRNMPFEYMTSRCFPNLTDHTTTKSKEMLALHTYLSLAHHGAFLFIDAINPAGTLNQKVYEIMGEIFTESQAYEKYLGGRMIQDVCIYFSLTSKMDLCDNGNRANRFSMKEPHLEAALGAAANLKEAHIPFGVISREGLNDLGRCKVLVLPDVLYLDCEEIDLIQKFVAEGGSLYVSGHSCNELLERIVGIKNEGETAEDVTYISPTAEGLPYMPGIDADNPLTVFGKQIKAKIGPEDEVIATVTLPYTDPADCHKFAAIHSNPPGKPTAYPASILKTRGKGKILWVAAVLESASQEPHKNTFINFIKCIASSPFLFESDTNGAVEIIAFLQNEEQRYLISIVNLQEKMPMIPVTDIKFRIHTEGQIITNVLLLPEEKPLSYVTSDGFTEIHVPRLDIFQLISVHF